MIQREFTAILDRCKIANKMDLTFKVLTGFSGMLCLVIEKIIPSSSFDSEYSYSISIDKVSIRFFKFRNNERISALSIEISSFSPLYKFEFLDNDAPSQLNYLNLRFNSFLIYLTSEFEAFVSEIKLALKLKDKVVRNSESNSSFDNVLQLPRKSFYVALSGTSIAAELVFPFLGSILMKNENLELVHDIHPEDNASEVKNIALSFAQFDRLDLKLLAYSQPASREILVFVDFSKMRLSMSDYMLEKRLIHVDFYALNLDVQHHFFKSIELINQISGNFSKFSVSLLECIPINEILSSARQDLTQDFLFLNLERVRFNVTPTLGVSLIYELGRFSISALFRNDLWSCVHIYIGKRCDKYQHRFLFEADAKDSTSHKQSGIAPVELSFSNRDLLIPQSLPSVYIILKNNHHYADESQKMMGRRLSMTRLKNESIDGVLALSKMSNSLNESVLNRIVSLQTILQTECFKIMNAFEPFLKLFQKDFLKKNKKVSNEKPKNPSNFAIDLLFQGIRMKFSSSLHRRACEFLFAIDKFKLSLKSSLEPVQAITTSRLAKIEDVHPSRYLISSNVYFDSISLVMNSLQNQEIEKCMFNLHSRLSLNVEFVGETIYQPVVNSIVANLEDIKMAFNLDAISLARQFKLQYSSIFDRIKMQHSEILESKIIDMKEKFDIRTKVLFYFSLSVL
jgi:Mor family transcriptional regulator